MNPCWSLLSLLTLLAMPARAGLLAPLDREKRADANDKMFSAPTLNQTDAVLPGNYVPSGVLTRPTIDGKNVESRSAGAWKVIESKPAELSPRGSDVLDRPVPERPVVKTERLAISDKATDRTATVSNAAAQLPPRQIAPNTAAGEDDLRNQLKKTP